MTGQSLGWPAALSGGTFNLGVLICFVGALVVLGVLLKTGLLSRWASQSDSVNAWAGDKYATPGIAAIKAADPRFDRNLFLGYAKTAFQWVQYAREVGNPDQAQRFLSSGFYAAWRIQQQGLGAQPSLTGLVVNSAVVMLARKDANYDVIVIRFHLAQAQPTQVSGPTAPPAPVGGPAPAMIQFWTFTRSGSVTTRPDGGLLNARCPNCGAELQINEVGHCHYCDAEVTNGSYDWVVSLINEHNHMEIGPQDVAQFYQGMVDKGYLSQEEAAQQAEIQRRAGTHATI